MNINNATGRSPADSLVRRRWSGGLAHEYKLSGCQVTSTLCN